MKSKDGLIQANCSGNPEFIKVYDNISEEYDKAHNIWVQKLIHDGFKASHPNDGWVDREHNTVLFCYPHFDNHPEVGDMIMLGSHTNYNNRPVRVTEVEFVKSMFDTGRIHYHFKDID